MALSRAMEIESNLYPPVVKDRPSVYDPTPYLNGPRHEFLQECVPDVNPRILSRMLDLAMTRSDPCLRHCNPPLLALEEASPNIFAPEVDTTRSSWVYGRRMLPKLRRELESLGEVELMRALMSVSDVVHDPERVCEAVRVQLAQRLIDLMQHENPRVRERSCAVAETLAGYAAGRDAVLEEPLAVPTLKLLLLDSVTAVRFRAALTLRVLARFRLGPYDMDEEDLAPFLVHLLLWETVPEILIAHLGSLQLFLELDTTKESCIYQGAFNPLSAFMFMLNEPQMAAGAMECLARLTSCRMGKLIADQANIVTAPQMGDLLMWPYPDIQRGAAMLIMNLTHTIEGKKAATSSGLLEPLLELAKHRGNRGAQLCALQALTNIAENPPAREFLLELEEELEELEVGDDDTEAVRQRLLAIVRWKP